MRSSATVMTVRAFGYDGKRAARVANSGVPIGVTVPVP
jgi:hypothetical protein